MQTVSDLFLKQRFLQTIFKSECLVSKRVHASEP